VSVEYLARPFTFNLKVPSENKIPVRTSIKESRFLSEIDFLSLTETYALFLIVFFLVRLSFLSELSNSKKFNKK